MSKDDPIAKALDLTPVTPPAPEPPKVEVVQEFPRNTDDQLENDFEYARRNMYDIIEKGSQALIGILDVADQSQHPRSYEVAANLIKTMSEVNKDLLELNAKKKQLAPKETATETAKTVTNNLFVGSTAELQAMLKKAAE